MSNLHGSKHPSVLTRPILVDMVWCLYNKDEQVKYLLQKGGMLL